MPLEFDITQPISQQQVGHMIAVVGTFAGSGGNPFNMSCTIAGGNPPYTDSVAGQINAQDGTWQCTFANVPNGTYDITAQVAAETVKKHGFGSNPVTEVVVTDTPVRITGQDGPNLVAGELIQTLTVRGTADSGYGLADGYVLYARLWLAGQQVSSEGRLTAMGKTDAGYDWQYAVQVPAWAWLPATMLIVELWKVDSVPKAGQKPAATVAQALTAKG